MFTDFRTDYDVVFGSCLELGGISSLELSISIGGPGLSLAWFEVLRRK
jgi:hypothetical protein